MSNQGIEITALDFFCQTQMLLDHFKENLAGKGLARCLLVRLQPLPFRTAREVFPQAAHPMIFVVRVMRTIDNGVNFHL
jgi:hypothetical protein